MRREKPAIGFHTESRRELGTLYVVRHGQAGRTKHRYDELTSLGACQAQRLGEHWAARGIELHRVFVGPRDRHRQTFEALTAAYDRSGGVTPNPVFVDALDELPAMEVTKRAVATLAKEDARMAAWASAAAGDGEDARQAISRLVSHAVRLYATGRLEVADVESFVAFRSRVAGWMEGDWRREPRRGNVVAITSGGPVAAALGHVLGLSDETTIDLVGMVFNASVSEFRYDATRLSLVMFNGYQHMEGESLTYV